MNRVALVFTSLTILIHIMVFFGESMFWGLPSIHEGVVAAINVSTAATVMEQSQILELVFFSQGFYNLFIALSGIAGLVFARLGLLQVGLTLVCNTCLFALGAGIVLASSTTAYPAAAIQGVPPLLALIGIYFSVKPTVSA